MSNEGMCSPSPEHNLLVGSVGVWDVKTKHFMEPGKPAMEGTAVDTVRAIGGFWTVSDFRSEFFGQPFVGQCTMGFDPTRKVYRMTWVDSMSHFLFLMEGTMDASGKKMTLTGKGPSMMGDGMCDWRSVMTFQGEDQQLLQMYMGTPMGEFMFMEHLYTRRK